MPSEHHAVLSRIKTVSDMVEAFRNEERNRCEHPTGYAVIYRDASATRCGIKNSLMAGITGGMSW